MSARPIVYPWRSFAPCLSSKVIAAWPRFSIAAMPSSAQEVDRQKHTQPRSLQPSWPSSASRSLSLSCQHKNSPPSSGTCHPIWPVPTPLNCWLSLFRKPAPSQGYARSCHLQHHLSSSSSARTQRTCIAQTAYWRAKPPRRCWARSAGQARQGTGPLFSNCRVWQMLTFVQRHPLTVGARRLLIQGKIHAKHRDRNRSDAPPRSPVRVRI